MTKIAAIAAAGLLAFGGSSAAAAERSDDCIGIECTVDCIKRILAGSGACPRTG